MRRVPADSGRRPSSASTSVVLPDPLGPTSANRSAQAMSRVKGPSAEVAPLDHRLLQAHDDVAGSSRLVDGEAQVPSLPRLLDRLQRVERRARCAGPARPASRCGSMRNLRCDLVVVARVLLLPGDAGGGPLAFALGPPAQLGAL